MRICSRVVITKGEHKNKTGTLMELIPIGVQLDGNVGSLIRVGVSDMLEIDDITNSECIIFEKGMRIYDTQFGKIGEVLEVNQFNEELQVHKIGWEDGAMSEFTLHEEFNFIVKS